MAFLLGPEAAADILSENGGLIVLEDGSVELHGRLRDARMREVIAA
jgi:hypothetical protein